MGLLFLGNLGAGEILIIALVVLLLFGGKKIPELMKGLGKGVKSFKDGMKDVEQEIDKLDAQLRATSYKLRVTNYKLQGQRPCGVQRRATPYEQRREARSKGRGVRSEKFAFPPSVPIRSIRAIRVLNQHSLYY